jgi:nucleoside-diphosphate-sugar epimerase
LNSVTRNPVSSADAYTGVRVVVLGASGFVGRWVARALVQQGADIWMVARNRAAANDVFRVYGVVGQLVELDLRDSAGMVDLYRDVRPSITFNCAGYGVDRAERDGVLAAQINTDLVGVICRASQPVRDAAWPGQDLVHAGSGAEYGEQAEDVSEDAPTHPTTVYGRSKLAGTRLLVELGQTYGIKGATARLFTVYGPGEHPGRLLPTLMEALSSRQPVRLTTGRQQRDFTYVEDVAEGLLRLGVSRGRPGEIVNLATGNLMSVRAFAETAARVLSIPRDQLRFGALPAPDNDSEHAAVRLDRLRQLVGWTPATTVAEGVSRTRAWADRDLGAADISSSISAQPVRNRPTPAPS